MSKRPLDFAPTIKFKLGAVILAAVAVVVAVISLGAVTSIPFVVVGVVAAGLALLVVQLLARGMTSPLREMARAATAMSRGDYSQRVTATSRDEVGELARAFNSMAGELAEIDRQRRDLIANVSHELRTPISAMQAVLENLVDGVEPPDAETLSTVLAQVERLGRLVAQLLDLSRLESGAVPIERRPFEVRPVLEQALRESEVHAARREREPAVRFDLSVEPDRLAVEGDPERVHQVVSNLVQNAVRHSPAGGTVSVSARGENGHVRIDVADEGPGIPEPDASRVFERFYRSDAARSWGGGGTGLGLAIARWIVDLHGGDIRVEANKPKGCRMVVELPRSGR